jgi:hypothetical protein
MPSQKSVAKPNAYSPQATVVFCRECLDSHLFAFSDSLSFACEWPECCGEPVSLITGAQHRREMLLHPPSGRMLRESIR